MSFCGCSEAKEDTENKRSNKKTNYVMYQPSEMANFMNAMYAYNSQVKKQIQAGETPMNLPLDLLKLHSAEMSEGKHRSANWNRVVNTFIASQTQITEADSLSKDALIDRYNTAINNCLACHKTECVGPIPRIKKLLIK